MTLKSQGHQPAGRGTDADREDAFPSGFAEPVTGRQREEDEMRSTTMTKFFVAGALWSDRFRMGGQGRYQRG